MRDGDVPPPARSAEALSNIAILTHIHNVKLALITDYKSMKVHVLQILVCSYFMHFCHTVRRRAFVVAFEWSRSVNTSFIAVTRYDYVT